MEQFDLIIIGSGPAGYRAAMQTAKLRKRVVVIEKSPEQVGGAWIHSGTLPSKTIRESLDSIHNIKFHAGQEWVDRVVNFMSSEKLQHRAREVADREQSHVYKYFDRYGVNLKRGTARLLSTTTVEITKPDGSKEKIEGKHILVATGSRPRRPKEIPFDDWRVVDADRIFCLETIPRSLVVFGGGVIGCEYACIFAALGVKTTVIEPKTKIMQYMDQEVAESLQKSMTDLGVTFELGSNLKGVHVDGPTVHTTLENGKVLHSDVFFFAAGRVPNTENIGLEQVGLKLDERKHVQVNEHFQSSVPNIYAAGDCIGAPALASTSASQGRYAALHMFGAQGRQFPRIFPFGVYTIPELSCVGSTEEELKAKNIPYVAGRASYKEVARGYIRGDAHGVLKLLVCSQTHKLLGIHIVGHDACNLLHIGLAFMQQDAHAQDLVDMIFNYPTLAEAYRIAAFNALNKLSPSGEIGEPPVSNKAA
jgi:NAD(P) transhydrogenase